MEIEVNKTVNVPLNPWCGSCSRKEKDKDDFDVCTLHNRFLNLHMGRFLKCRECYKALYDAIEAKD